MIPENAIFWFGVAITVVTLVGVHLAISSQAGTPERRQRRADRLARKDRREREREGPVANAR